MVRARRATVVILVPALAVACSAPSADPREMAETPPPVRAGADRAAADGRAALAFAALDAGSFAVARDEVDTALSLDPSSPRVRAALGAVLMAEAQTQSPPALDSWRRAEGELRRAVALAPNDADVGLWLARFYSADGHVQAALAEVDRVLATHPEHLVALRLGGFLAYEGGEERRARSFLARALVIEPSDAEAAYCLAACETELARRELTAEQRRPGWEVALAAWVRCRELAPDDVDAVLAEAYVRQQRLADGIAADGEREAELRAALALYREASTRAPQQPEAAFGEGVVHEALGDPAAAEAAYRRALAIRPDHPGSLLNLIALRAAAPDGADEVRELAARALRAGITPLERRQLRQHLDSSGR